MAVLAKLLQQLTTNTLFIIHAISLLEISTSNNQERNRKIAAGEDNNEDERKSSAINTHPSANRNPKKRKVEVENAMEVETSHTDSKEPFVYYRIFHNEQMSRITRIKVKDKDYIDSIIDAQAANSVW